MATKKKKRVFKTITIRLSLFEFRDIDELKKEVCTKTLSKAMIKAAVNYKRLKQMLAETQNQLDILIYEKQRQQS